MYVCMCVCMYVCMILGTVTSSTGLKRKAEPVVKGKGAKTNATKKSSFGKKR